MSLKYILPFFCKYFSSGKFSVDLNDINRHFFSIPLPLVALIVVSVQNESVTNRHNPFLHQNHVITFTPAVSILWKISINFKLKKKKFKSK